MRHHALRIPLAALLTLLMLGTAQAQQPMRLYAAGSLTNAMTEMLAQSGLSEGAPAIPVFGPSGVLREKIEAGAPADILASADMAQPRRMAGERDRFALFVMSETGQAILAKHGFQPVALPRS